ncbi:MAG: phage portal protein [Planctomycetota bacterium]
MARKTAEPVLRSLENPSVSLTDPEAWNEAYHYQAPASGVRVSRKSGLSISAVYRGVRLLATDLAKLPLVVYRNLEGGGKERAREHPAYTLLRRKANSETLAFTAKQTLAAHAILEGNGYAYIDRAGDGSPRAILNLLPHETWPVRENGKLLYVTKVAGEWRKLLPQNVLHLKNLSYDGLVGYSLWDIARESLGLNIAQHRHGSRFYANNAAPGIVIEVPTAMKKESIAELLREWNKIHQGLTKSHKAAVLTNGAKVNPFTINPVQSQFLQSREFEIREVANWLGLPPHKLGDKTRTAYASLEQEQRAYLEESLDGWLVASEEECRDKLLSEEEKRSESHTVEFLRDALLRADRRTETEMLISEVNNGLLNVDEARSIRNQPALPDGLGQGYRMPANLTLLGGDEPVAPTPDDPPPGDTPETEPPEEDVRGVDLEAFRAATEQCVAHQCRRTLVRVNSLVASLVKQPGSLWARWEAQKTELQSRIVGDLRSTLDVVAVLHGGQVSAEEEAEQLAARLLARCVAVLERITTEHGDPAARWDTEFENLRRQWPDAEAAAVVRGLPRKD